MRNHTFIYKKITDRVDGNSVVNLLLGERTMKTQTISLEKGEATGHYINLGKAALLVIQAKKGYVMCGYLNMNAANKYGDIAGKVTGVKTFDDMLNADVVEVSENAKLAGLREGMNVKDFLNALL
jgi:uncharacterized protein YunC (DUF1805 family)